MCPTNSARLLNFGIHAGEVDDKFYGEYWSDGDCYKFLEACIYVYQNTGDLAVKAVVDKYIPWIVASQQEDGYLNTQITLTGKERWSKVIHHELYNIGHFLTFASAHYDITGETVMLECARKLANYTYGVFKDYPRELAHFGFNPSQIMGLCDLYRVTGDVTYYKLAEIFVNMRGSAPGGTDQNQDRVPLREETMAIGHAVTSTYLYAGATDVYAQTGEAALLDALKRIYTDMTTRRTYITGASSPVFVGYSERGDLTHEAHATYYELPNKIAYNESCANIGNAMWAMRMLTVTGESKYGDFAEQVMYNAGISGSNLKLTRYFYSNPLSFRKDMPIYPDFAQFRHKSSRRWHTFTCWCCPPQLFRTMAGMGRWVYGQNKDTVYVNFFTDCDYVTQKLELQMRTKYPWEDRVTIDIKKADHQNIRIRIPAWCKNPSVNGSAVTPGGFFEITVNTGDTVTVDLPMVARLIQANPNIEQDRGMIAVMRGPVVYCAEGLDNPCRLDDLYIDPNGVITEQFEPNLLDGVVTLQVSAKCRKQKEELYYELVTEENNATVKMIPYYTWANREESDMSVWFPKA